MTSRPDPAGDDRGQDEPRVDIPDTVPASFYGDPEAGESAWAVAAHLLVFVLPIVGALAILLTKGKQSVYVREHALEAFNGQFVWLMAASFSLALMYWAPAMYPLLLIVLGLLALFAILGAVAAATGNRFGYPFTPKVLRVRE